MKIRFDQSGGFAGLLRGCEIDASTLPAEEASKLEQLVKASAISESGEFVSDSGRDLHQYEISIEDRGSKTSVIFDEETVPDSVKPLIGYLKQCSKPKAPGE